MKERELRSRSICAHCQRKIGETRLPIFYTVMIARHGLDLAAIERHHGLTMFLGGSATLANVMGPDEEMTATLIEPATITICEECASKDVCVHQLAEYANKEPTCTSKG